MRKIALITGITGQDRLFLAEFLLGKGYDVHGIIRHLLVDYRERNAYLEGKTNSHLYYADLTDLMSMLQVVSKVKTLGWEAWAKMDEDIRLTYEDFLNNPMRAERR